MPVLQMVERRGMGDAADRFGLEPNPDQVAPINFRSGEAVAFLAGAQDLLALCIKLIDLKFRVVDFTFRDRYFNLLTDEHLDDLSSRLERSVKNGDLQDAVMTLNAKDVFVESARVRNRDSGHVMTLQTDGVIDGARDVDEPAIVAAMQKAFAKR